jgi:hypothetical protein
MDPSRSTNPLKATFSFAARDRFAMLSSICEAKGNPLVSPALRISSLYGFLLSVACFLLSVALGNEPRNTGSHHEVQSLSGFDGIDLLHRVVGKGRNVEIFLCAIRGLRRRQDGSPTLYRPRE